jgi:hypothetical protein
MTLYLRADDPTTEASKRVLKLELACAPLNTMLPAIGFLYKAQMTDRYYSGLEIE